MGPKEAKVGDLVGWGLLPQKPMPWKASIGLGQCHWSQGGWDSGKQVVWVAVRTACRPGWSSGLREGPVLAPADTLGRPDHGRSAIPEESQRGGAQISARVGGWRCGVRG